MTSAATIARILKHATILGPLVGPVTGGLEAEITKFFQAPKNILRKGSKSALVRLVQARLNDLGRQIDVDGIYGDETHAAVTVFQASSGLDPDGVCGHDTLAALFAEM